MGANKRYGLTISDCSKRRVKNDGWWIVNVAFRFEDCKDPTVRGFEFSSTTISWPSWILLAFSQNTLWPKWYYEVVQPKISFINRNSGNY
jgi:hypothetical protein